MKRVLSIVLAALMIFSVLPFAAFAEEVCAHKDYEWVYHGGEKQEYDCTKDTVYRYKKCLTCAQKISEDSAVLTQSSHVFVIDRESSISPTCKTEGTNYYNCIYCTKTNTEEVPALAHKWSEYYVNRSCFADGSNTPGELIRFCDLCGEADTKTINNHTYFITEGKKTSCFSAGMTDLMYCLECGIYSVPTEVPQLEHEDKDNNQKCDLCDSPIVFNGEFCGCVCHSEIEFIQFLLPLITFIWKLLGIDSCACGTVHY